MFDATQFGLNAGLPPSLAKYMNRYVQVESGGNPNEKTGSYSGLLQMGPDESAKYGGNGIANGAAMYADNANWFQNKFGRQPSPTELYLVAQQGRGGIANHLANPSAPAWQNMYATSEGQEKGPAWAKKAVWGNVPDDMKAQFGNVDNVSSDDFVNSVWKRKIEGDTAISQAMDKSGAQPMADQGALSPNAYLGPGALDAVSGGLQGLGAGLLAINNPAGGAAMMSAYQNALMKNRPQLVDGGTDPMTGKKRWMLYDPQTQSFKNFGGAGGKGTASGGDDMDTETFMANLKKVQSGDMSVDDFKKSANPLISDYAQAMVNGTADPRMLGNRAGVMRPYAIAMAHVLDPNFNENDIDARKAEAKNLATSNNPGTLGGAIASLGKLSLHGEQLAEASKHLADLQAARGTLKPLTWLENTYKANISQDQEYKTALNSLKAAVDLYAPEADRATTGKPSTDTGSEKIRALFSPDISHDERMAAARRVQGMAQDAVNQLAYNNNRAFGRLGTGQEKTVEDFMSPEVRKSWANLQKVTSPSGGAPQPTSQGTPQQGPVPSKVINGKQYHLINGNWYTE